MVIFLHNLYIFGLDTTLFGSLLNHLISEMFYNEMSYKDVAVYIVQIFLAMLTICSQSELTYVVATAANQIS